ncbi:transcriptional regulator MutR [Streptococcus pneumoniae GA18523]|nr:transcriptional regulator MutR [Streptococcus pneumoniae GA47281]EHD70384.1 transcriptional regulator MutR [Streptococcus pneumoniae GA18523]EHE14750.1 transcriptional regulator MutR [Streptococcus pneumoniae GA19451]EHE57994.1 transcriptional regulator MutR [Streptococcus pneumoniae 5185-06]EHZ14064.1 transcriptional regulator MutR [Streptococcus pneumoniae GA11856]EHZ28563.1 hypothetical protein SPAR51_1865 [Streptococcus pneumoniae GA17719]EIA04178.1 helix-turn-helix family protein [Str
MLQLILYQNLNFLDLKGEKMKFLFQHFLNYYQISMFR